MNASIATTNPDEEKVKSRIEFHVSDQGRNQSKLPLCNFINNEINKYMVIIS